MTDSTPAETPAETLADFATAAGLTLRVTPVPFRLDARTAGPVSQAPENTFPRLTEPFHWLAQILTTNESTVWAGWYSAGTGLAEAWAAQPVRRFRFRDGVAAFREVRRTGRLTVHAHESILSLRAAFHAAPDALTLESVLESLQRDVQGLEWGFRAWAEDLGEDPDSIAARDAYDSCVATADSMVAGMGWPLFNRFLRAEA